MIPGLEQRLMEGSDENVLHIAELVRPLFMIYYEHFHFPS